MYRDGEAVPRTSQALVEVESLSALECCIHWVKGWWYHRRLAPQFVSLAVAVLVDRREPYAALAMCEIAQGQQPQNVHAYTYAIHLAMRCRQRTHRALASYMRGKQVLVDPRAQEILTSYYLFKVGSRF